MRIPNIGSMKSIDDAILHRIYFLLDLRTRECGDKQHFIEWAEERQYYTQQHIDETVAIFDAKIKEYDDEVKELKKLHRSFKNIIEYDAKQSKIIAAKLVINK